MSGIINLIRRVVQQELAGRRSSMLGVVTTVYAHSAADDENNYEVDVRLKHTGLELRRVPVAVGHVGIAAPPRVGDLVLVQFVNDDINQALVTGRFYHADERPPLFQEDEILFEQRVAGDESLNHLRFTPDGTIYLQRDVTKPEDNSAARTSIKIDGASGDIEITAGDTISVTITNDNSISIQANGKPIEVACDKMTIEGNVDINGDLKVSSGANSTTISGNEITGA